MTEEYKEIGEFRYELLKTGNMKVPGIIYASSKLFKKMKEDKTLEQVKNVACLPGIIKSSIAMSDAHQGYGFSIGGVAAFDAETGIITPGGIGFDINCGVRLLTTNLTREIVEPKILELLDVIYRKVPVGVGKDSSIRLNHEELDKVLTDGVKWAISQGFGTEDDLKNCESEGQLIDADSSKVSPKAKKRGKAQLGTLGAGNHFIEIQVVDKIYDKEIAKVFGFEKEGQIAVMIHTGSRGLGHQVCSDYLRKMEDSFPEIVNSLPEKDLIYAPINSEMGKNYYSAMCAAANFAWCNRHIIGHAVKASFKRVFENVELKTVYDVAHNIAKKEEHIIDGKKRKVCVHRKGATRAFPAQHPEVPEHYKTTGHPVLIPGSMGTASYVLVGTQKSLLETFGSSAHGAGRLMSRHAARKSIDGVEVKKELELRKIYVKSPSAKGIADEAPQVYKDIDEVIRVTEGSGICRKIVRLIPLGVIKG